ncbi:hypothetical protein K8R62_02405 [bacterium]|nr:hypothetical protein [bacterium]
MSGFKNVGAIVGKTKDFMVISKRRLFFKVDKRSISTALKPILEFNHPMHRKAFEEWCSEYASWADCPFLGFCQRVQKKFDFKKGGSCLSCQVISDELYQDKKFVDFINFYSAKNDASLAREIDSGKFFRVEDIKPIMDLSLIQVSSDDYQFVNFEPAYGWPLFDESFKVVNKVQKDIGPDFNRSLVERTELKRVENLGKTDEDGINTDENNSVSPEESLAESGHESEKNYDSSKDIVESQTADIGEEEKVHDTRSFFYLFLDGNKTELKRMTVVDACALALVVSKKKGMKISLFKKTKNDEKEIDWVNHRLTFNEDLPDFLKKAEIKDINPKVKKSISGTSEKPLHGARYFRLEWPGGSLGPVQMFIPDAYEMAVQKAQEIGDYDVVKLFKVTLKDGKEKEVAKWFKKLKSNKLTSQKKEDTEVSSQSSGGATGLEKHKKGKTIKISGNFSFTFNINIDIE